jgi:hypothetical protein
MGQVRAEIFDPKLKKNDLTQKLHTKLRANPNPTRLDHVMGRAWANIF